MRLIECLLVGTMSLGLAFGLSDPAYSEEATTPPAESTDAAATEGTETTTESSAEAPATTTAAPQHTGTGDTDFAYGSAASVTDEAAELAFVVWEHPEAQIFILSEGIAPSAWFPPATGWTVTNSLGEAELEAMRQERREAQRRAFEDEYAAEVIRWNVGGSIGSAIYLGDMADRLFPGAPLVTVRMRGAIAKLKDFGFQADVFFSPHSTTGGLFYDTLIGTSLINLGFNAGLAYTFYFYDLKRMSVSAHVDFGLGMFVGPLSDNGIKPKTIRPQLQTGAEYTYRMSPDINGWLIGGGVDAVFLFDARKPRLIPALRPFAAIYYKF